MLGYPANIKNILSLCKKKKVHVIEDTAWGLGEKINKKYLGTFGRMGTYSFDYAKSITTGEGGMIVLINLIIFLQKSIMIMAIKIKKYS